MATNLDDIRSRAEQFYQEIGREHYLEGAGLKQANAAAVYERFADLGSPSLLDYLRSQLEAASADRPGYVPPPPPRELPNEHQVSDPDHRRRLEYLFESSVQTYLGNGVRELTDHVLITESKGTVVCGNESMPYRSSAVRLVNEADRERRARLARAREEFVTRELNPLLRKAVERTWQLTVQQGYKSVIDLVERISGIDLFGLHKITEEFLAETEDMYVDVLSWASKKKLGLRISELTRHDLAYLSRGQEFDALFDGSRMMEIVLGFMKQMGIDPTAGGRITIDIAPRPAKSPRAFCAPVRIPDEVYLSILPTGGKEDYEALLHELGHALHFASVDPALPWEYRGLGDNSITETYALTFDHLILSRAWLRRVLGTQWPDDFLRHAYLIELMMLRRYCAKLSYELALHGDASLDGKEEVYREFLGSAMKCEYPTADYLTDVDPLFYSARYLRAWILQSMLDRYLTENFGADWFLNPRAGAFFLELWQEGQKFRGEELARQLAFPVMTMDFLAHTIERVLGA